MKGTLRATVKVTWTAGTGERRHLQREKRFVRGTPKRVIEAWKLVTRSKLERRIPAATNRATSLGTLAADAARYYPLIRTLADWVSRRSEIRAWLPALGERFRHTIEREDILRIRGEWKTAGVANRTINNRVAALRDLYRKLDGDTALNPCDGVKPLTPPRTPIERIDVAVINGVIDNLARAALEPIEKGRFKGRPAQHALKDRARLMVLATTGKRPCEVARALPQDVNLTARVWGVRDAKHGWSEGMYLNDEMLMAWQAFVDADAWGEFQDHFPRRLREAGWPKGVRIYSVRHSTWIAASERGADLSDIQAGAGHKHIATTRDHYVPVLRSRMQRLSELIDHRFGWADSAKS